MKLLYYYYNRSNYFPLDEIQNSNSIFFQYYIIFAVSVQSFQEKELSLYSDLSTLIKDASWLRHYMASALRIQGEALTGAARALGDTVRPESGVDVSSLSLGSQGPGTSASQQTPGGVGSSMNAPGGGMMQQQQQQQQQQSVDGGSGSAVNPFLSSGVIRQ